ncbi:hypothetical protein KKA69_03315 [Patescibacteria group bacterium]|nr:hypothetical protein [Patescibacteria group bacterium]
MFIEREPNQPERYLIRRQDCSGRTVSLGIAEIKVTKAGKGGTIDKYELINPHWIYGTPVKDYDPLDGLTMSISLKKQPPLKGIRTN